MDLETLEIMYDPNSKIKSLDSMCKACHQVPHIRYCGGILTLASVKFRSSL